MSITLVTGGTGFVGRELVAELQRRGVPLRVPLRTVGAPVAPGVTPLVVGDFTAIQDLAPLLAGVDCVIHLAARAHVTSDQGGANEDLYRLHNETLTRRLAAAASEAGVRRFVFVSSIKAFGERDRERPYKATDVPEPCDAYGRSKLAAERALLGECAKGRMEPVIVRPPLVYGPGVRANFLRIMRIVDRELLLPLGSIRNRRSMVSCANLVDFLRHCREAPGAVGQTLLVSDGEDLSTPELVRRLARAMRRRTRLLPMPVPLLKLLGRLTGRGAEVSRLTESLSLDISASRELLSWTPPVSVDSGLQSAVDAYLRGKTA